MLTLLEINKAINAKVKQVGVAFDIKPVPLLAEDVSESIKRPSLKVGIKKSINGRFNSNCREKDLTFRVYFFAKDRYKYKADNAKMQDLLENAFLEDLYVAGTYIPITNVETEVSDTVLVLSFDVYLVELIPGTDSEGCELMEELKYKENIK